MALFAINAVAGIVTFLVHLEAVVTRPESALPILGTRSRV
jgi:hypothetical protein